MENKGIKPPGFRNVGNEFLMAIDSPWYKSILKIYDEFNAASYEFYRKEGLMSIYLPITTSSISSPMGLSSDSIPMEIEIEGQKIYLADSMQFLLEYGCRFSEEGVYYIMPSFRGEPMDQRHLNQFFHSEAEIRGSLNDVMDLVERYVKHVSKCMLANVREEIMAITGDISHIEKMVKSSKFKQIRFKDAVKILEKIEGALKVKEGYTFITNVGERYLISKFDDFVWLTHFERLTVPFYQTCNPYNIKEAMCADLLFGIGEVVGAGERCLTGDEVIQSTIDQKVDATPYEWYIDLKNKFPIQTSGFGMGIERYLLWLLKHDDIRDTQLILRINGQKQPI